MAVKRPVFICMLALILGELMAFAKVSVALFAIGIPLFLVQIITMKKNKVFFMVIFVFIFIGFCTTSAEIRISEGVYSLSEESAKVVAECVQIQKAENGHKYIFENAKILNNNKLGDDSNIYLGNLHIYETSKLVSCEVSNIEPGDVVKIEGRIKQLDVAKNFGNFDSKKYYKTLGVYVTFSDADMEVVKHRRHKYRYYMQQIRENIIELFDGVCSKKTRGVFVSIITGNKFMLDEKIENLYQATGIAHILAVSGLHISSIGVVIYKLLRKKYKFVFSGTTALAVVIGFVFMTGEGVSAVRAGGMFGFYLFSQMTGNRYDMLNAMSFIAIILCLSNPFILLNSSFQMSFGAVFAIVVINPVLSGYLGVSNLKKEVIESKKKLNKMDEIRIILSNGCVDVIKSVTTSLSINLILTPILLWNYYQIYTYSIFINVFVVPLLGVVISTGLIAVIAGGFLRIVTGVIESIYFEDFKWMFNIILFPGNLVIEVYEYLCEIFSGLPGGIYVSGKPEVYQMFIYYTFLSICLIIIKYKDSIKKKTMDELAGLEEKKKQGRVIILKNKKEKVLNRIIIIQKWVFISVLTVVLVYSLKHNMYGDKEELVLCINDVGQGDCIVMIQDKYTVMIDGGSSDIEDLYNGRIESALKARGVNNLDCVFITHEDEDHISGVIEMLKADKPDKIKISNLYMSKATMQGEKYKEIKKLLDFAGVKYTTINYNDVIRCGGMSIKCIHPFKECIPQNSNAGSLVLEMRYKNFRGLFTGDISAQVEAEILNEPDAIEGDYNYSLLKVAHHGSKYSSSEEFLNLVKPYFAVVSCGENNTYGHPHEETMNRLGRYSKKVLVTADSGQIVIKTTY